MAKFNCGNCNKEMRYLDPHVVVDDKYMCKACGDTALKAKADKEAIEKAYDAVGDVGPFWLGYYHKAEYKVFLDNGFTFDKTEDMIIWYMNVKVDKFVKGEYSIYAYRDAWAIGHSNPNVTMGETSNYSDTNEMDRILKKYA